jgi:hypothetical protein
MLKEVKLFEIESDGFLHSQADEIRYDCNKKYL